MNIEKLAEINNKAFRHCLSLTVEEIKKNNGNPYEYENNSQEWLEWNVGANDALKVHRLFNYYGLALHRSGLISPSWVIGRPTTLDCKGVELGKDPYQIGKSYCI